MKKTLSLIIGFMFILAIAIVGYYHFKSQEIFEPIDPLYDANIQIGQVIDLIVVNKARHEMTVFYQEKPLKRYKIALGFSPIGHKTEQGDGKTPEGVYTIIDKNPNSMFHLSLKISYPSKEDLLKANQNGVSAGGDIMIHGLSEPFRFLGKKHTVRDWTLGCIALSNEEIEELYAHVAIGTKIIINP